MPLNLEQTQWVEQTVLKIIELIEERSYPEACTVIVSVLATMISLNSANSAECKEQLNGFAEIAAKFFDDPSFAKWSRKFHAPLH